jgi:hypothetical protein
MTFTYATHPAAAFDAWTSATLAGDGIGVEPTAWTALAWRCSG